MLSTQLCGVAPKQPRDQLYAAVDRLFASSCVDVRKSLVVKTFLYIRLDGKVSAVKRASFLGGLGLRGQRDPYSTLMRYHQSHADL